MPAKRCECGEIATFTGKCPICNGKDFMENQKQEGRIEVKMPGPITVEQKEENYV